MFERYTEQARRTIFFGRYEASQFGSPYIETEHLVLGLLREDKALANRVLGSHAVVESIRKQIEGRSARREKVSTSVDLPLSHECKRVLAYGAEEAERLNHEYIGTTHLLLGLLREENCFAAQLLRERGVTLDSVRDNVKQPERASPQGRSALFARLDQWITEMEARGGIRAVRQKGTGNSTTSVAIYASDQPEDSETGQEMTPARKLAQIQHRIDLIVEQMENAIATHQFEKARFYSDEERKERRNLRLLLDELNLEEAPPRVPLLWVEIIGDERFSEVQKRCDSHIAQGVPEVWLLEPECKRAYTVTKGEGLRAFKGEMLQIEDSRLEMDTGRIFD